MARDTTSTIDVNTSTLALRDDLIFAPQRYRGGTYWHIECKSDGQFHRIGHREYVFISMLDGTRTMAQALAIASQHLGDSALTSVEATQTYMWLLQSKLGTLNDHGQKRDLPAAASAKSLARSNAPRQHPNPFWTKVSFAPFASSGSKKAIQKVLSLHHWLFRPTSTVIGIVLIAIAAASLATHWSDIRQLSHIVFSPHSLATMAITWLALKLLHEFGHAAASQRYGIDTSDAGLVFILFAPMPYVDVTSAWRLPSKWQRIHIAAAGMFVELVVAAVAAILLVQTESTTLANGLFNIVIMAGVSTVLFNANPLMRFDGYYILSDLLEIPNLYGEGSSKVRRRATRIVFGPWRRRSDVGVTSNPSRFGVRSWLIEAYGWFTLGWRVVICVSLTLAASILWHGAGVVLAVIGIAMWLGSPLHELARAIQQRWRCNRRSIVRGAFSFSTLGVAAAAALFMAPAPFRVFVPGMVDYADAALVRCDSDAFIDEIHVDDGQVVEAGTLLIVLRNDNVTRRYKELALEIEQTKLRRRIAMDEHDVPESHVQWRNLTSLHEQLSEITRQYEAQFVRAPVSGTVARRGLSNQIGTFVPEGSILLTIKQEEAKEVIVYVAHDDLDRVVRHVGSHVQVRMSPFVSTEGLFSKLEPRASTDLDAPCLAAAEGGPLAVESETDGDDDQPSLTMVTSRFRGIVTIPSDSAPHLPCGQRVALKLYNGRDCLGSWLATTLRAWIESKLDAVRS